MGYVKLSSDLPQWAWYEDNNTLAVYIRLILGAAWRDCDYQNVHLKRGQIATTLPLIAQQSKLTVQQIRTILERLKSTGKITVEKTPKFSIITLIEYDCLTSINMQNNSQITGEQQSSNSLATGEQQSYFIINRNTEDNKAVSKSEVTACAASASPTTTSPTRESLIEIYGKENVDYYEKKFDKWKADRGGVIRGEKYKNIAKWMENDGVKKPVSHSSFDTDEVMANILKQYQKKR